MTTINLSSLISVEGKEMNKRTSTYFNFAGLTYEVREGKNKVQKPVSISKRAFTDLFDNLDLFGMKIENANYLKLLKISDTFLKQDWSKNMSKLQDENQDSPEVLRLILDHMKTSIRAMDTQESQADIYLEVKRIFAKSGKYENLLLIESPAAITQDVIQEEIDKLNDLLMKAKEVTKEDFISYIENKYKDNGTDEAGMVKLTSRTSELKKAS
jgi:hypothetical protein